MSIQRAFESVQKGIQFYSSFDNTKVAINLCLIKKVNYDNLTADIFIPKTSTKLFSVPILFPYLSLNSGMITMPKENSAALVVMTSDNKPFIISSVNKIPDNYNPYMILDGENIMFSPSESIIKQDAVGNQIFVSGGGAIQVISMDSEVKNYSSRKTSKTIVSKTISGVTNIVANNNDGVVRAVEYSQYYGKLKKDKVYSKEDFIIYNNNNKSIDESKKQEVISLISDTMKKIDDFFNDIENFKQDIFKNPYISKEEIEEKVFRIKEKLYNNYSIEKKATLTIEKGLALKNAVNSIYELENLKIKDVDLSDEGNVIVFRLKVINNDGNEVASVSFDEQGNVKLKCKDFKLEKF